MLKAKQLYAPPYIISHDYEKWYYYFGGRASSMFLSLGILPLGYALTILSNNIYIHKRFSFPFYHQPDVEKGKNLISCSTYIILSEYANHTSTYISFNSRSSFLLCSLILSFIFCNSLLISLILPKTTEELIVARISSISSSASSLHVVRSSL